MKNLLLVSAVAMMACACGGGGGNEGDPKAPGFSASVNKLAAYVGTWAATCNDHAVDNATITSTGNNTVTIATRTDYYAQANCTGAIIATETEGADITATYVDTVDAPVVFATGTPATTGKVDRITASMPIHSRSITGTAVTRVVQNGKPQWCIDFGNGRSTCILDEGAYSARSGVAGGLLLQGNAFYELVPNGTVYEAYGRYVKK